MARNLTNKRAIRQMTRDLQKEFNKNPVRVPIEAEPRGTVSGGMGGTVNYNAPVTVVNAGDHAQIAWESASVNQGQGKVEQVATGYEDLARILATLLEGSAGLGLTEEDREALDAETTALLHEVATDDPDRGLLHRGITMVKGFLAPVVAGAGQGLTDEAAELSRTVIEQLGSALPG